MDLNGEDIVWRHFPTTDGYTTNDDGLVACRIYETIRAQKLWNAIMSNKKIVNYVKLNIYPDGGISRFRIFGKINDSN